MSFSTPILFIIFNRPDVTEQVFEQIKKIKPSRLYISADGPRNSAETSLCEQTRAKTENIDWPCEVNRSYQKTNLGCGRAVSKAITWLFENEHMGIILEDDCLPALSFFPFTEELLHRYKDNKNVWSISGSNFQTTLDTCNESYYFSMFNHIWGWATWRDRWEKYSFNVEDYNLNSYLEFYQSVRFAAYFNKKKQLLKLNKLDTWDYQWLFCMWKNKGFAVIPNSNLIVNIGLIHHQATNTKSYTTFSKNLASNDIEQLRHPRLIELNRDADLNDFKNIFRPSLIRRVINLIKSKFTVLR